jgi:magnesium chelatase subunit I
MGMIPSIIGKMELVYEGEQEGAAYVAEHLILEATKTLFLHYFPKIEKLKKQDQESPYDDVIDWFSEASSFELANETKEKTHVKSLLTIEPLILLLQRYQPKVATNDVPFLLEFMIWGLVGFEQLSKKKTTTGLAFNDPYDELLRGI